MKSVFAEHAWKLLERDISVVPIAPGTKKPGAFSEAEGWRGMGDWTRFAQRMPSELELGYWDNWPGAGLGVVLGKLSGIVALDKDYDLPGGGNDALQAIIPPSNVAKKGEKGWTRFYRYNGERSCAFDVQGARVLDVLSDGRQTVIPPTAHPCGLNYTWITEDTLFEITSASDLPVLPDDFLDQVERVLAPYQSDEDKRAQRQITRNNDGSGVIDTSLSITAQFFRELNEVALSRLDEWVPHFVATARRDGHGFRAVATWRNCTNPNVGITPDGIRDWGGGYGMTPIDLVMYANNLQVMQAAEALRSKLRHNDEVEAISMTVGGVRIGTAAPETAPSPAPSPAPVQPSVVLAPAPAPKPLAPTRLPWELPQAPALILPPTTSEEPAPALPPFVVNPPGVLRDIAQWITDTAPKTQPELSLAAALSLAATCTQRIYTTPTGNFTSLYMVMVAKSTEGKEHPQGAVQKILTAAGLAHLIAGSGYTSAGAVFSALIRSPSHLAVIDEMGKLLKLSRAKGSANSEAAIDKLVEAYGKLNGSIRPPCYSVMTMSKQQATQMQGGVQLIYNPAISVLGATTPGTFYASLTDDLIGDGFLGRLIVVESRLPRQLVSFKEQTDPPKRVVDWCKAVNQPVRPGNLADLVSPETPANTVLMTFSDECQAMARSFELELNRAKDALEPEGLDVLLGRTFEKALRLGMIAAKAVDARASVITAEHLQWAIDYVRHYDMALVAAVRKNRVRSVVDTEIKRLISYIQGAKKWADDPKLGKYAGVLAQGAMPRALLLKRMHMSAREFDTLINTAYEAGLITKAGAGQTVGYAGEVYYVAAGESD